MDVMVKPPNGPKPAAKVERRAKKAKKPLPVMVGA